MEGKSLVEYMMSVMCDCFTAGALDFQPLLIIPYNT